MFGVKNLVNFGPQKSYGLPPQIFTCPTTPKVVFSVGLAAPGSLKLGSAPYLLFVIKLTLQYLLFHNY